MGGRRRSPGRREWAWYELDRRWADRLVEISGVGARDLVLDIGAGRGPITARLLRAEARVIAVELHPERAEHLRTRFGDSIVVVPADAADLRLPRRPFHVVANPPFAVTTPLLRRLTAPGSRLESATLALQDHAARRWARPDAPGAGRWQRRFVASLGPRIPPTAFHPRAPVSTRVLRLQRRRD